jgi:Ca-activated chloride channel family protein
MKQVALCALIACASMACASQTTIPHPQTATSNEVATDGSEGVTKIATAGDEDIVEATVQNKHWLNASGGSEFVHVGGQEQFIGVWVDVPKSVKRAHVPMALTLTIDTSGSMGGQKIVQARAAAKELVRAMKNGDIVSIHTFSDSANELVHQTVLRPNNRQVIMNTLSELSADGATNMFDALQLAIGRARSAPSTHPVRRVVIISDGRATAGPTSTHTLADIAERGTQFGVQVTALGVGLDYDEDALNALAVRSSGRLFHLADASEMPSIIKAELNLLQKTMATNATVRVVPAPGVQLLGANGVRSSWGTNRTLEIPLGTMFAGQRREVLVRFRMMSDLVEGTAPIASARLHFNDPTDGGVPRVQEVVVRGKLTTDMALVNEHQNPDVQAIVAMNEASTLANLARADVSSGNFDNADLQLARAEKKLRERAHHAKNKRDKKRILAAVASVATSRRGVQSAAKAKPAAKRKAQRASSLQLNDFAMEAQGY